MKNIIVRNDISAKENNQICCTHCSSTLVVRNGTYARNDPRTDKEIRVQRYLCKSPECPWKSFSIPPKFILPVIRHVYGTLLSCHAMVKKGMPQAEIVRKLGVERGVAKRLKLFCRKFMAWFVREKTIANWGTNLLRFWPDFTRDFSQSLYPGRWVK